MRWLATVAIVALLAACSGSGPAKSVDSVPSLQEAQEFLGQLVSSAQRRDFAALCAMGDLNCQRSLDVAGRDAVPARAPTLIDARVLPTSQSGDQVSVGGLVLVMCGTDAAGKEYRSEMLVFRDGARLRAINPVYWGGGRISGGRSTSGFPVTSPAC